MHTHVKASHPTTHLAGCVLWDGVYTLSPLLQENSKYLGILCDILVKSRGAHFSSLWECFFFATIVRMIVKPADVQVTSSQWLLGKTTSSWFLLEEQDSRSFGKLQEQVSLVFAVGHITPNVSMSWLYFGVRSGRLKCDQLQWPLGERPIVSLLSCSKFTQHTRFSVNRRNSQFHWTRDAKFLLITWQFGFVLITTWVMISTLGN